MYPVSASIQQMVDLIVCHRSEKNIAVMLIKAYIFVFNHVFSLKGLD